MADETKLVMIIPLEAYDSPPEDIEHVACRAYLFHSEVTPLYLLCKTPTPVDDPKYPAWKASFSSLDLDVIVAKATATADEESRTVEHEGEIAPKIVINRILRDLAPANQGILSAPEHNGDDGEKRVETGIKDAAVPSHHEPSRPPLWIQTNGDLVYKLLAPLNRLDVSGIESVSITVTAAGGQDLGRDLHVNFGEEGALEDILSGYFPHDPPKIGASRPSYLQSVTKTMPLIPPPKISVRSSALSNQKVINVSLANRSGVPTEIRDAQVLVTVKAGKVAPDVFHVTSDPSALPITIKHGESYSFVFFVEPTLVPRTAQPEKDQKKPFNISYNTVFALAWTASPLLKTKQYLTCQYDLASLVLSPGELSISVSVPRSVYTNSRFPVSFTITNAGSKPRDVSLILHQPRRSAATSKDKSPLADSRGEQLDGPVAQDAKLLMVQDELNASLVCMDETLYMGRIDSLTSKVASVDFFAFKPGAYELAMAHLYDHPIKSFLEVRCPVTCVYVLPDPSNPQR